MKRLATIPAGLIIAIFLLLAFWYCYQCGTDVSQVKKDVAFQKGYMEAMNQCERLHKLHQD